MAREPAERLARLESGRRLACCSAGRCGSRWRPSVGAGNAAEALCSRRRYAPFPRCSAVPLSVRFRDRNGKRCKEYSDLGDGHSGCCRFRRCREDGRGAERRCSLRRR
uniref:Uncharacterized protein n=1 Tax=Mycena chlorophos TaxID=658473 RepID=A0ABQ0KXD8_MYCCL|nr:predicted protein [Mycena chlorophos]